MGLGLGLGFGLGPRFGLGLGFGLGFVVEGLLGAAALAAVTAGAVALGARPAVGARRDLLRAAR